MKNSINALLRKFEYEDKVIEHLLGMFDDFVISIRDYGLSP